MIDERDVREMLQRRAGAIPAVPADPTKAVRRARRRLAATAIIAATVAVLIGVATLGGARALADRTVPVEEPTLPPVPTPTAVPTLTAEPTPSSSYVLVDIGTRKQLPLPAAIAAIPGAEDFQVDPISRRWTFDSGGDLYVAGPGAANVHKVTTLSMGGVKNPFWSPDGTRIVFSGPSDDIYVVDAATGAKTQLTHDLYWSNPVPSFTPDGSKVVFTAKIGRTFGLWTTAVAGGEPQLLMKNAAYGVYAPDGSKIVFWHATYHDSQNDVHMGDLMSWDGRGRLEPLVNRPGVGPMMFGLEWETARPTWSPDSSQVALAMPDDGVTIVSATTGDRTKVGGGNPPAWLDNDTLILQVASP